MISEEQTPLPSEAVHEVRLSKTACGMGFSRGSCLGCGMALTLQRIVCLAARAFQPAPNPHCCQGIRLLHPVLTLNVAWNPRSVELRCQHRDRAGLYTDL